MESIITTLLLLLPILVEAIADWNRIIIHKKVDNHKTDLLIRAALMAAVSMTIHLLGYNNIWPALFTEILLFTALFDVILNIMIGRAPFSTGTTSWWDRQIAKLPIWGNIFIRIWLLITAGLVWFQWDWIIS